MHRFHLLLADDHASILFTFGLALESEGYDVDTACTISETRAKMEARYYDLLILDLRFGAESGLTLLAGLRAAGIETPVLMMTAQGSTEEAVAAMKLGAVDFLSKPLEPVRFRVVVADILRRGLPASRDTAGSGDKTYEREIAEARHALNCRDLAAAHLHLARALEINSHSADAHYLFGSMLELNDNPERARRYYHRALQLYAERSFSKMPFPPRPDSSAAMAG